MNTFYCNVPPLAFPPGKEALPNLIPVHARHPLMSTQRPAQPPNFVQGVVQGVVRLIRGGRGIHAFN